MSASGDPGYATLLLEPRHGGLEDLSLSDALGPLANLPGRWSGYGFRLSPRPLVNPNDCFLDLNLTTESLQIEALGALIPAFGSAQTNILMSGATYRQDIADRTSGEPLHVENGMWLNVPATTHPPLGPSVAQLVCQPTGSSATTTGTTAVVNGPPSIAAANAAPFAIGGPTPSPGNPNPRPEYDLTNPSRYRTDPLPRGITQSMLLNPNVALTDALAHADVIYTVVLSASSRQGGVASVPFVRDNTHVGLIETVYWVETIRTPQGGAYLRLQYSRTVLLNFVGMTWPQVSVGTLTKVF